jgi:hypothetical protein
MTSDEVLIEYMNEHYAHGRDHEHLRSEITTILCAAAFLLIGLVLEKSNNGIIIGAVGAAVFVLGMLNFAINRIHQNRFRAHVAVAAAILSDFEDRLWDTSSKSIRPSRARAKFDEIKSGSLSSTWNWVPAVVCLAGVLLVIYGGALILGLVPPLPASK